MGYVHFRWLPGVHLGSTVNVGDLLPIVILGGHPKDRNYRAIFPQRQLLRDADGRQNLVVKERGTSRHDQLMADRHGPASRVLERSKRVRNLQSCIAMLAKQDPRDKVPHGRVPVGREIRRCAPARPSSSSAFREFTGPGMQRPVPPAPRIVQRINLTHPFHSVWPSTSVSVVMRQPYTPGSHKFP